MLTFLARFVLTWDLRCWCWFWDISFLLNTDLSARQQQLFTCWNLNRSWEVRGFLKTRPRFHLGLFQHSCEGTSSESGSLTVPGRPGELNARQVRSSSYNPAGSSGSLDLDVCHSFTWYPVVSGLSWQLLVHDWKHVGVAGCYSELWKAESLFGTANDCQKHWSYSKPSERGNRGA